MPRLFKRLVQFPYPVWRWHCVDTRASGPTLSCHSLPYTLSTLAILPPPPSLPHPTFAGSACQAHNPTRMRVTSFRKHALVLVQKTGRYNYKNSLGVAGNQK